MASLMALLTAILVVVGGCASQNAVRSGDPGEGIVTGSDLELLQRVFLAIERSYADTPDFNVIAAAAADVLQKAAPGNARTLVFPTAVDRTRAITQLTALFRLVRETTPSIDARTVERAMILRALEQLDGQSVFLAEATYRELREGTSANRASIGAELAVVDGALTVIATIEESPAEKVGLRTGDRIRQIDAVSTAGMTSLDPERQLPGRSGTTVHLTVARAERPETLRMEIARERMAPAPR